MLFRVGKRQIAAHEQKHPDQSHLPQLRGLIVNLASAQSAKARA